MCCEQCQLDSREAAHPGGFTPTHKEDQGVDDGQQDDREGGEGEESDCTPTTFLASTHRQQEGNTDQQGGQLIVTEGVQEHICGREVTHFKFTNTDRVSIRKKNMYAVKHSYLRAMGSLHLDLN